ncbi:MAG: hypothetical protein A4E65_03106 [Syntrophorhabdus sp. PtaU1.Bin153]|nr:MAG: hypothetical protein A4E65_03106 [Syntrophorhabdus sp. PtaU1.Bin153]
MNEKKETWAIVELFGHQVIVGKLSEHNVGGCSFVRVDVPKTDNCPAYTRLFGNGAIYSITPCDEETATAAVRYHEIRPMNEFSARMMLAKSCGEEGEDS